MIENKRARILIVDDIQDNIAFLEDIFNDNYVICTALSGDEAIRLAISSNPDLILLDVCMPIIDGYEVCRRLKQNEITREIPIIFLSAASEVANKITGFKAGGIDYLVRPFSTREIIARVQIHLDLVDAKKRLIVQNMQLQEEISLRQATEEKLRTKEYKYRSLFEKTNDAMFIISINGTIDELNLHAASLLGASIAEITGRKFTDFINNEEITSAQNHFERLQAGEQFPVYERSFRTKDGKTFIAEVRATLIKNDDGVPLYIHSVVRDITERKFLQNALSESEERYRQIIENTSEAVFRTDASGCFTYVNPTMTQRLNMTEDMLLGKHYTYLIDTGWRKIVSEFFTQQIRQRLSETVLTFPLAQTGEQIWVEQTTNLIFDGNKVVGFLGITRDITEKKVLEQEREDLIADLDAYAHTVAHDLKSPLTAIKLSSHLLERYQNIDEDSQGSKHLNSIRMNIDKMTDIIDELLLFASVRNKSELPVESLIMSQVISKATDRLEVQIKQSQAKLQLSDDLPPAFGYAPWIEEVWANFLSNAIKYGGNPPEIQIGAYHLSSGYVRYWIKDNGIGISPDQQQLVFTAFTRLNQTTIEGHGIGLSIVQRIVQKLGGTVGLESQLGVGSTFYFTLPGQQPDKAYKSMVNI
ncbi:MAG: PAS domain S-box protein [Bacteroidota bacterium]